MIDRDLRALLEDFTGIVRDTPDSESRSQRLLTDVLPGFVDACSKTVTVWNEDSRAAIEGWRARLTRDLLAKNLRPDLGHRELEEYCQWVNARVEMLLKATEQIAVQGMRCDLFVEYWTSPENRLPGDYCPPKSFWEDLYRRLDPQERGDRLSSVSRDKPGVRVRFPLVWSQKAYIAELMLTLSSVPTQDQVYLDPSQLLLRRMTSDFAQTFQDAYKAARAYLGDEDTAYPSVCVRISAMDLVDELLLGRHPLSGNSFGGALFCGLVCAWKGIPWDPEFAISLCLEEKGGRWRPRPIEKEFEKAGEIGHRALKLCVAEDQKGLVSSDRLEIIKVRDLDELFQKGTWLGAALQVYYGALIAQLEKLPLFDSGDKKLSDVKVPIHVYKYAPPSRSDRPGDHENDRSGKEGTLIQRYEPEEVAALYERSTSRNRPLLWSSEFRHIERVKRAVVTGEPGGGKTFLARYCAIQIAKQGLQDLSSSTDIKGLADLPLPLYVSLDDLALRLTGKGEEERAETEYEVQAVVQSARLFFERQDGAIPEINTMQLQAWKEREESFWDWIRERLSQGSTKSRGTIWLICDGLDQVASGGERLMTWLNWLSTRPYIVIVTCRTLDYKPHEFERLWGNRSTYEYELAQFTPREMHAYIQGFYGGEGTNQTSSLIELLHRNTPLAHACQTPLILHLMCAIHQQKPIMNPTIRRSQVYDYAIDEYLFDKRRFTMETRNLARRLLPCLAWYLFAMDRSVNRFSFTQMETALRQAVKETGMEFRLQMWLETLRKSRLLVHAGEVPREDNPGSMEQAYSILHRTFLEYLVGSYLAGWVKQHLDTSIQSMIRPPIAGLPYETLKQWIERNVWRPDHRLPLIFCAGKLGSYADACREEQNRTKLVERTAEMIQAVYDPERPEEDDIAHHRLALAILCLAEARPKPPTEPSSD